MNVSFLPNCFYFLYHNADITDSLELASMQTFQFLVIVLITTFAVT